MQVNKEKMETSTRGDFSTATELADYLVRKGLSFREAHKIVGEIVLYCIKNKKNLSQLNLQKFKLFHKIFEEKVTELLNPHAAANAKTSYGGTSLKSVKDSIRKTKQVLEEK
jgi:argininosuccinate lyase